MSNKKFFIFNTMGLTIALYTAQTLAGNFNITPVGTLPTGVVLGQTVSANFTVTNLTHSARNGYVVAGLPLIVNQNTTPPNCGNPINLRAYESCQLQLDITDAVNSRFALCKGNSCTTSGYPLTVSVIDNSPPPPPLPPPPPPVIHSTRAYIAQTNSIDFAITATVIECSINQTTGLLELCQTVLGNIINGNIRYITINNAGDTAFLTTDGQSPQAYQCSIMAQNGTFSGCTTSTITSPPGYMPSDGSLALNADNTFIYLVDSSNNGRILSCPVSDNTIQPTCIDTGASIDSHSAGITFNATQTTAYIGNYNSNYLTTCAVNGNVFSNCGNKTGDGQLTFTGRVAGVTLNSLGTIIYITDGISGNIYGCDTTSAAEATTFEHCFIASQNIPNASNIALDATNTFAYITDNSSTVYTCPIKNDNTFDTCTANSTFLSPLGIAII